MLPKQIHIIGGGISGLYFALLLSSNKNVNIHVYEKQPRVGGRIRTEYDKDGNVLFETGPWRIHPSHKNILGLIERLNLKKKKFDKRLKTIAPSKENMK